MTGPHRDDDLNTEPTISPEPPPDAGPTTPVEQPEQEDGAEDGDGEE